MRRFPARVRRTRHEAEQIKARIGRFLHDDLHLDPSDSKTAITHAAGQAVRFLGYEIRTRHNDTKVTGGRRAVNGVVGLFVPQSAIRERCRRYMKDGKSTKRGQMLHDEDSTIVEKYGAEYRGIVQQDSTCLPNRANSRAKSPKFERHHAVADRVLQAPDRTGVHPGGRGRRCEPEALGDLPCPAVRLGDVDGDLLPPSLDKQRAE